MTDDLTKRKDNVSVFCYIEMQQKFKRETGSKATPPTAYTAVLL
jgi:hypothetical protein